MKREQGNISVIITRKFLIIKPIYMSIMALLLFLLTGSCIIQTEPRELISIDKSIVQNIIQPVRESMSSGYKKEKSVIVLRISKNGRKYRIKASVLYKDDFKWYLVDKKDKLFGFTEYKGVLVLVYGNSSNKFYAQTEKTKYFEFLKTLDIRNREGSSEIELEPVIFEPEVWVYSVSKKGFQLSKKGPYTLLE